MTIQALCDEVDMSKQAYYKSRRQRSRREVDETLVLELVRRERAVHPCIGVRKLLYLIGPELLDAGVEIGRDRLFEVMKKNGLSGRKRRRHTPRTTDSRHGMRTYENLFRDMELTAPHQAWVSDLTYIRTEEGFIFLSLVMDAYSRKIVGWEAGATLEADGCVKALMMAIRQLPVGKAPVHHSDRGTQYCSRQYTELLDKGGHPISMTVENHCYENAQAERLNGILKQEYGLESDFNTKAEAVRAIAQAVMLYNSRRPHLSLNYLTPEAVHRQAA